MTAAKNILQQLPPLRSAAYQLAAASPERINACLRYLADLTLAHQEEILRANRRDLERMDPENPKYDRLQLDEQRLENICNDLRRVAELPSPLGEVLEERTLRNGLHLQRVRVPIGVIAIVFESRPNVAFDVFALCLKSGNVSVLKGSRDAADSNRAIFRLIQLALDEYELKGSCLLAPAEREALAPILTANEYVDLIIPRGSQGLIDHVRKNATVPVVETGAGICHVYVDGAANPDWAKDIVTNAKARRVSVCNALDCLLIHRDRLADLPEIVATLGSQHACKIFADQASLATLKSSNYPAELLHPASPESYGTEFLSMQMAIKVVDDLEAALDHIAAHGSRHSEAIVSDDPESLNRFLNAVDAAAVYANGSTAFTDGGEFDLGAEIGISTQKLHARGPMGLRELTSYKYLLRGQGHVR